MRVLLRHPSGLKRLAGIQVTDRDGSLILTFPREGTTTRSAWRLTTSGRGEKVSTSEAVLKGLKVTIHGSGRINFMGRSAPIFVEPIWALTEPSSVVIHRIPSASALDDFPNSVADEDFVVDASDSLEGPLAFEVVLAPAGHGPVPGVTISLLDRLQLCLVPVEVEPLLPPDLVNQFVTFLPAQGTRESQVIDEDIALIAYKKLFYPPGYEDGMLDGPNGEGWYRLVFPVQMRIAPSATIVAADPSVSVEIMEQELDKRTNRVQVRFRFRNAGGVIKRPTPIASIELSAEFST